MLCSPAWDFTFCSYLLSNDETGPQGESLDLGTCGSANEFPFLGPLWRFIFCYSLESGGCDCPPAPCRLRRPL